MLDAHQRGRQAVLVAAYHGDGFLIVLAFRLLLGSAAQFHLAAVLLAVADVEDEAAQHLKVGGVEGLAKFGGVEFLSELACFREVAIVASGGIVEPQPQSSCLQDQRQAGFLFFAIYLIRHRVDDCV